MKTPQYHFFICNSYRIGGEAQGACNKKGATELLQYLETEILDRGMDGAVSSTGCLKVCTKGPVMVLYPQAKWFGEVTEEKIDAILDALEEGEDTSALEI
ncbi:MAG: (2Fe-2S) ferredoxin domain-containing protein [Kiritimatiellaceae bacterium]|nr:(2Fe-2S) ferredoxin domain-containing protein [Kiritimatiellaceae bacterium]